MGAEGRLCLGSTRGVDFVGGELRSSVVKKEGPNYNPTRTGGWDGGWDFEH